MLTRREFMQFLPSGLAGGAGAMGGLFGSISPGLRDRAGAGSTFLDAEHVVILMQENRSFDHAFGSLRGVRGFNDPRAITLPDGNPVWVQANAAASATSRSGSTSRTRRRPGWARCRTAGPTRSTPATAAGTTAGCRKRSGHRDYANMPLTLGHYTRDDIPFYYALADAFTVCDQHFCSSLTGTTPNRLYLWTGTIRDKADGRRRRPSSATRTSIYEPWVSWPTFPERLEDHGVSWKIYQNELTV